MTAAHLVPGATSTAAPSPPRPPQAPLIRVRGPSSLAWPVSPRRPSSRPWPASRGDRRHGSGGPAPARRDSRRRRGGAPCSAGPVPGAATAVAGAAGTSSAGRPAARRHARRAAARGGRASSGAGRAGACRRRARSRRGRGHRRRAARRDAGAGLGVAAIARRRHLAALPARRRRAQLPRPSTGWPPLCAAGPRYPWPSPRSAAGSRPRSGRSWPPSGQGPRAGGRPRRCSTPGPPPTRPGHPAGSDRPRAGGLRRRRPGAGGRRGRRHPAGAGRPRRRTPRAGRPGPHRARWSCPWRRSGSPPCSAPATPAPRPSSSAARGLGVPGDRPGARRRRRRLDDPADTRPRRMTALAAVLGLAWAVVAAVALDARLAAPARSRLGALPAPASGADAGTGDWPPARRSAAGAAVTRLGRAVRGLAGRQPDPAADGRAGLATLAGVGLPAGGPRALPWSRWRGPPPARRSPPGGPPGRTRRRSSTSSPTSSTCSASRPTPACRSAPRWPRSAPGRAGRSAPRSPRGRQLPTGGDDRRARWRGCWSSPGRRPAAGRRPGRARPLRHAAGPVARPRRRRGPGTPAAPRRGGRPPPARHPALPARAHHPAGLLPAGDRPADRGVPGVPRAMTPPIARARPGPTSTVTDRRQGRPMPTPTATPAPSLPAGPGAHASPGTGAHPARCPPSGDPAADDRGQATAEYGLVILVAATDRRWRSSPGRPGAGRDHRPLRGRRSRRLTGAV